MNEWENTKPQDARVIDVLALGPFMVWFGIAARGMPDWARFLMVVAGAGTIIVNGANYLAREHEQPPVF